MNFATQAQVIDGIIGKVSDNFDADANDLRDPIKKWLDMPDDHGIRIVDWKVDPKEGRVIIITRLGSAYRMVRFFTIAGKWTPSVDVDGPVDDVISRLLVLMD